MEFGYMAHVTPSVPDLGYEEWLLSIHANISVSLFTCQSCRIKRVRPRPVRYRAAPLIVLYSCRAEPARSCWELSTGRAG